MSLTCLLMYEILDWSEVWALLIPLAILLFKKPSRALYPVVWYVWIGLVLNIALDSVWKFAIEFPFTSQPGDNIFLYKTHSIVRFILFSWFFISLRQALFSRLIKVIFALFIIFAVINFTFFESFPAFETRILSVEAGLLLINCLIYYFNVYMQDQQISNKKNPAFWVTTGLSIYTVINFPIFLFYKQISIHYPVFGDQIWDIHNVFFIILCIFLARAFYIEPNDQLSTQTGRMVASKKQHHV